METDLDETAAPSTPWSAEATDLSDGRLERRPHFVGVDTRRGIKVEVEPAQDDERRYRRVDNDVCRSIERQIQILVVLIDLPEEAPTAAGYSQSQRDRQSARPTASSQPEHEPNDILDFCGTLATRSVRSASREKFG